MRLETPSVSQIMFISKRCEARKMLERTRVCTGTRLNIHKVKKNEFDQVYSN